MYKLYEDCVSWLKGEPVIQISQTLPNACTMAMRFAACMARHGHAATLVRETGNPDMPEEVIHYVANVDVMA